MKKILLVVTAALAITGCSQSEEFENPAQKAEIQFKTVVGNSTKAAIVTKENFMTFAVSGFRTTGAMSSDVQLTKGFMDDVVVTKNADTNVWEYTNPLYWPTSGKVQFFATSPAQALNVTSKGYPTFDYTVGAIGDQKDLVVATKQDADNTTTSVVLPFQHALTQVNFSIKGDSKLFTYEVSELKITGVKDKGTFTFGAPATTGTWTDTSTSTNGGTYTYTPVSSIILNTNAEDLNAFVNLDTDGSSLFMLLPQDIATDGTAEVSITYIAHPKDKTDELDQTFNGTKTIKLTGKWDAGTRMRYTLQLTSDAKNIAIGEPTVEKWDKTTEGSGDLTPVDPAPAPEN